MKYQFTLFSEQRKPLSCIIEADSRLEFYNKGKAYKEAVKKICLKRSMTTKDLAKYGYNKFAVRKNLED